MDGQFSYESDIAPIQGRYFGNYSAQLAKTSQAPSASRPSTRSERIRKHFEALNNAGLSDSQRMKHKMQALSFTDQLEDRQAKRQKRELDLVLANQRVESNRMSITAARDSSRREREANGQIDEIVNQIKGIRDNPELSDSQRRDLTNNLILDNGVAIANSPVIRGTFDTAMKSYDYKIQEGKVERAERDRLIAPLINSGMTSAARKLIGEENIDPKTQKWLAAGDAIKQAKDEEAGQRANSKLLADDQENQQRLAKEVRENTLAQLNRYEDTLKNLDFGTTNTDENGMVLLEQDPNELSTKAVSQLKGVAKNLGVDSKGLGNADLLDLVQRSLIEQREKFSVRQDASGRFVLPTFHKPLAENERKFLE